MESKVIAFLTFLCIMQGINSKALNPFWGANPYMAPPMDPTLQPIVSEIQMRLSQAQAISKSAIGMNVGLASKNIGLATSQAKTSVKALINGVQSNPNTTKDCMSLSKDNINLLNSESKSQLSYCSKSSQVMLKSFNQVHKEFCFQAASLNQELNMAVSQCQLQTSVATEPTTVADCVSVHAEEIKEKITALEQNIFDSIQAVDTNIGQIVNDAKTCTQQVQLLVQEQTETIAGELDQCSNTLTTV